MVTEEDFSQQSLKLLPAGKARDWWIGSAVWCLAYGQDDRVCAFTSLFAMLDVKEVEHTACCILVDKKKSEVSVQQECIPASLKIQLQNF